MKIIITYPFNKSQYSFEIYADSLADAERQLELIKAFARIDGELKLKIPVFNSRILQRIVGKLLSWFI
jgi:hypothetical protein